MEDGAVTLGTLQLVGMVVGLLFTGGATLISALAWMERRSNERSRLLHDRIDEVRRECMRRDEMERILTGIQRDFDEIGVMMRDGFSGVTSRIDMLMAEGRGRAHRATGDHG